MERYNETRMNECIDAYKRQRAISIAKENPVKFTESYLGVKLAPHQKLIIEHAYEELLEG